MAEWWSIEVFHGEREPATRWRDTHEDTLIEAALTSGALYWEWNGFAHGVIFEVCFADETQWNAFRALPAVQSALDAVPDPVNGLLIYPGRGGAAGSGDPRKPKPAPSAAGLELEEPRENRWIKMRARAAAIDRWLRERRVPGKAPDPEPEPEPAADPEG